VAGKLKGACSFYINHEICNRKVLDWQDGYGVVSFGTKDLPWVIRYVKHQKQHHAGGTTHERLERVDRLDESSQARGHEEKAGDTSARSLNNRVASAAGKPAKAG
jgi:hypothetical protein